MAEPRPQPFFIGDDLALDFLNSLAAPWGAEIEWLGTGGDFVAWLEQAHAVPTKVSAHFRAHKRRHGLNCCRYRGDVGIKRWVGLGVLADNLINIGRAIQFAGKSRTTERSCRRMSTTCGPIAARSRADRRAKSSIVLFSVGNRIDIQ